MDLSVCGDVEEVKQIQNTLRDQSKWLSRTLLYSRIISC